MARQLPLTGLKAFEAAARHLSFKAAAEELGVTPTAISHQIRQLEDHCGQPLFRRRPRPLALTEAGERLRPVIRDGFATFAEALSSLSEPRGPDRLRVTATNAFSARWLVPRAPAWRARRPGVRLDIVGTDAVLDLSTGEADIAIRYARQPPKGVSSVELMRDRFLVVGSAALVGETGPHLAPADLARYPLIEAAWPARDTDAPTWARWQGAARERLGEVPDLSPCIAFSYQEELHAIEAVIAGQGIGICSDVLIAPELAEGRIRQVSEITLPGYGFYLVQKSNHPKRTVVAAFSEWALEAARSDVDRTR